jgi:protein ImuB
MEQKGNDMADRRILSLWFPRLGAERALRRRLEALDLPLAVVGDRNGAQVLTSLDPVAESRGLHRGQPLRDAMAICPALVTVTQDDKAESAFLEVLLRWAGKFSPWVAAEPPDALVVDLTGCAHLFGGEAALLDQIAQDCAALGLSVRAGIADTLGAAWALARYGGGLVATSATRSGDNIAQEAHATRSRAATTRRAPVAMTAASVGLIAPPGRLRPVIGPLPLAALRLDAASIEGLAQLGLRRIDDIAVLPRAALARRFGASVLRRLDQALGLEPEPVTPAGAPLHFAARLSLPDPIGLAEDLAAGVDRLLAALVLRLQARGHGARRVRLQAFRTDGSAQAIEVGLARASDRADRIRPLLALKLPEVEAGFGIDALRLSAVQTEPLTPVQHRGHLDAGLAVTTRAAQDMALEDLVGRLGARLGAEAVTRLHPGQSHAPEKAAVILSAAWSDPHPAPWPHPRAPRPLILFRPEPVTAPEDDPAPPARFRWRRRDLALRVAAGPERIAPEWWLDDPDWRSGPRDYWRVETDGGERLWLFFAHGADMPGGWFCHGQFA